MNEDKATVSTGDFAASKHEPSTEADTGSDTDSAPADPSVSLFSSGDGEGFRSRWHEIQVEFVDHPRQSVEQADALVAEVMQDLAQTFADERQRLESQWGRGDDVGTEDLRVALQRYSSFFERLLTA